MTTRCWPASWARWPPRRGWSTGWTGDAADNFRKFVANMGAVPANQAMVFRAMHLAMRATKKVYEQYLRDLKDIAAKSRAALHPSGCHPPSLKVVIGVAAGISKTLAGFATIEDGAGAFVAIEGLMELANVAAEGGHESGEEHVIEGADVNAILMCTDDLLRRTVSLLDQREQEIVGILTRDDHVLTTSQVYYVTPQPSIVGLAAKPLAELYNEFD